MIGRRCGILCGTWSTRSLRRKMVRWYGLGRDRGGWGGHRFSFWVAIVQDIDPFEWTRIGAFSVSTFSWASFVCDFILTMIPSAQHSRWIYIKSFFRERDEGRR